MSDMGIQKEHENNLKALYSCLEYLQKDHRAWEIFHKKCWYNVATYVETIRSFVSIFNHMPTKLIKAENLMSHINTWETFKVAWYRQLSCNYNETWIPISDFRSGEDEMFVDIENKELPVLITKFLSRDDFRKKIACESLVQFIKEYKDNMEKDISKETFREMEIIKAFEEACNKKDVSQLLNYLVYNFHYSSQWLLEELTSSSEYLDYLEDKFLAIKNSNSIVKAKIISNSNGIIITQIDGDEKREAILVIKVQNGLAYRADLCIPEMAFLEKIQ